MSFCSFSGGEFYKDHFETGMYVCAECGHELFSSRSKYEHSTPWPAFTETIHENSVSKHEERWGAYKIFIRTDLVKFCIEQLFGLSFWRHPFTAEDPLVKCGKCGNGLGHEFVNDGPKHGLSRFWIFSSSLKFIPKVKNEQQ